MNKRELRKLIREQLLKESNKAVITEGILEKLLMALLSPMIKREAKKIKNDPEIKAAEEAVQIAIDQWKMALDHRIEMEKENLKAVTELRKKSEIPYKSKNF